MNSVLKNVPPLKVIMQIAVGEAKQLPTFFLSRLGGEREEVKI